MRFETTLSAPQPDAVRRINVGDVLDVDLHEEQGRTRFVVRHEGGEVGALTERIGTLLRCIQNGARFTAEVLDIDGGMVSVRVEYAG